MTDNYYLNMGPQHPSTHGVLRLVLRLDGETVLDAVPDLGYLHRGMEKIAESRTYSQFLPFVDRIDYIAALLNEHGYCLAVEKLLGVTVPARAEYIRVIVAELNRIASHIVWYGPFAMDLGAITPFLYAFREREMILDMLESVSGQRLTFAYMRIGGVRQDLPEGFIEKARAFCKYLKPKIDEYETLLTENAIFLKRTKGVGILSGEAAINYGCTGPVLRGSGVKYDIRKNSPYSVYPELEFDIPTGTVGDTWDRYKVRLEEMRQSARIIEQALEKLPSGPIMAEVPKIIKPAPGEAYGRAESSRGEIGFFVVSDGTQYPVRLKIRTGSFSNLSALRDLVKGLKIADVVAVLGSIDIVLGEVDR
ncbi:MAG: NADH-quinone oxidoreductase subunit D [Candidatus Omnitrophica bacterium]|nr:NADH-quinone oxidoreductase subunit D [Candidatus Omnitrophota bacterium]